MARKAVIYKACGWCVIVAGIIGLVGYLTGIMYGSGPLRHRHFTLVPSQSRIQQPDPSRFLRVHGSPTRGGRVSGLFGEEAKGAGRRGASVD